MMSPETLQQMAHMYEESLRDSALHGRPLETMRWAYQEICAGEDPWTALGNFTHAWYGYAKTRRAALVSEPLTHPEPETEHMRRWAAFCAASVEFLCERYTIPCPSWVSEPRYALATPWWYSRHADTLSIREQLVKMTPPPFARRNIFCTNRLFQNKYEMYEWTQEARAQGITDPRAIWNYARDKEISIRGA